MSWIWDAVKNVYRRLLRTLGIKETVALRDEFTGRIMEESDRLTEQLLVEGTKTLQEYVLAMRSLIRDAYVAQYQLAIGGVNNMTAADWGRLGGMLQEQYRYLQGFAQDLASGKLSVLQAMGRGRMYIDGSTQSFERGQAAMNDLALPQYPGDGGTVCLSNCKCHWEIRETADSWRCYWRLGAAEHCPDCLVNSRTWNPLVIQKISGFTLRLPNRQRNFYELDLEP